MISEFSDIILKFMCIDNKIKIFYIDFEII